METIKAILTRRSIRKYSGKTITTKKLEKILKAAMYAPSAYNNQPWHFILIKEKEIILKIQQVITHAEMLKQASAAVLICGDKNLEQSVDLIVQDCSAATQNALLAAHSAGLGAVWVSVYPIAETMEGLKKLFSFPDNIIPISLVSIGYPDEEVAAEERFKPEKIHYNGW